MDRVSLFLTPRHELQDDALEFGVTCRIACPTCYKLASPSNDRQEMCKKEMQKRPPPHPRDD
jgi:hypothetical protein